MMQGPSRSMKLANRIRQYVEMACHMAYASSCIQNVEKYERVSTLQCLLLSDKVPPMVGSLQSETTSPIPPSLLQNHMLFNHGAYSKPTSLRELVHRVPLRSTRYRRSQRPVPHGPPNITQGYLTKKNADTRPQRNFDKRAH